MRILLVAINAKYIHSNPAVYSLRSYAERWKDSVDIAEYTINGTAGEILADIYRRKPEVVAFSCYIWNMEMVSWLLWELPKLCPDTKLWLGGPEVSFRAEELLTKYHQLTGIMVGEGEETFADLCAFCFEKKGALQDIPGLCLPGELIGSDRPFSTGERASLPAEKLPFIYEQTEDFTNRIIYYESQRGCPFRCSYCLSSIDREVRHKPIAQVKEELAHLLSCRVPQVKFIDRTFNCNHRHALEVWQYIAEHDNGATNFHFEIAADLLTEEELTLLESLRPGLVQLEIGIQSTNTETLRAVNRVTDIEKGSRNVRRLTEAGNIHVHVDLIAGLPFEDIVSFRRSYDEVFALGAEMLQLGFLKVLHGSPIENDAKKYGIVSQNTPPYEVLYTNWLTYNDVLELKGVEEMTEIYYNSNQYRYTLRQLLKGRSPYAFFEGLSRYCRENGYSVSQPSRLRKYEILRAYALQEELLEEALLNELLTLDLYLRENAKRRPDFAHPLGEYREMLSVRDGRNMHEDVFVYRILEDEPTKGLPRVLCFDYDSKDALTNNAAVFWKK